MTAKPVARRHCCPKTIKTSKSRIVLLGNIYLYYLKHWIYLLTSTAVQIWVFSCRKTNQFFVWYILKLINPKNPPKIWEKLQMFHLFLLMLVKSMLWAQNTTPKNLVIFLFSSFFLTFFLHIHINIFFIILVGSASFLSYFFQCIRVFLWCKN